MSTYVEAYKGYIADVPKMWFKRCDGNVYYFDELTQAQVNPETSNIEINAGHSLYPVAYIPGQSTMTMDITSGQFDADLFAMANDVEFEDGEVVFPEDAKIDVEVSTVTSLGQPWTQFLFKDFKSYSTAAAQFYDDDGNVFGEEIEADSKTAMSDALKTLFNVDNVLIIEFDNNDVGFRISGVTYKDYSAVCYYGRESYSGKIAKIDNKKVATGEAVLKWPVYASGEDCTDSAIKGYVILRMYRARLTRLPGFDSSYKNAETFSFELSAMDPKRSDRMVYSLAYVDADTIPAPSAGGYPYWPIGEKTITVDGVTITAHKGIYTINGHGTSENETIYVVANGEDLLYYENEEDIPVGNYKPASCHGIINFKLISEPSGLESGAGIALEFARKYMVVNDGLKWDSQYFYSDDLEVLDGALCLVINTGRTYDNVKVQCSLDDVTFD